MEQCFFPVKLKGKPSARLLQIFIDCFIGGAVGLQIIPLIVFTFCIIHRVSFQLFECLPTQKKSVTKIRNFIHFYVIANWPV